MNQVGDAVTRKQLGLLGIQERVSLVGGQAVVESSPGHGARLHVCVPLLKRVPMNDESGKNVARIPEAIK